ncbi:unnamed protein product [Orchesella dallaii]|uniref:Uncharacterized protein n=1 Tax=Orchesella dallaii TaxID=48710 RepID=A0ABP1R622_9HEXA
MAMDDMSWHSRSCRYRGLVEDELQSNLLRTDEMREEFVTKYTKEALATRVSTGGKGRRKKPNTRAASSSSQGPLTAAEEAFVKQKVDTAMAPRGFVSTYLADQRRYFEEIKGNFRKECRCVRRTVRDIFPRAPRNDREGDPPMPKLVAEGRKRIKEAAKAPAAAGAAAARVNYGDSGDEEEEEYGIYF